MAQAANVSLWRTKCVVFRKRSRFRDTRGKQVGELWLLGGRLGAQSIVVWLGNQLLKRDQSMAFFARTQFDRRRQCDAINHQAGIGQRRVINFSTVFRD